MTKLSAATIERVLERLDRSLLTRGAFSISQGDPGRTARPDLTIRMRDYPEYRMEVKHNTWDDKFSCLCAPGSTLLEERLVAADADDICAVAEAWIVRLQAELRARAIAASPIASLERNLSRAADRLPEPERPFTRAEANEWTTRLDAAVADLQRHQAELNLAANELSALREQVAELKKTVTDLPRRVWVRSAGGTIAKFLEKTSSKALAAIAEGAVRAMLPPST
jgi:hypothetical protein